MKNSPFYQPALKGKECPVICRNKPLSCTEVQLSTQAKDTLHSCLENDSFLLCALHVFRLGNDIESGLFPVLYILHTFTTKSLTQSTAKHLNVHILTTTYYCKNSHWNELNLHQKPNLLSHHCIHSKVAIEKLSKASSSFSSQH